MMEASLIFGVAVGAFVGSVLGNLLVAYLKNPDRE